MSGSIAGLHFHERCLQDSALIPDGYMEFSTSAGIDASFLEVDLGSRIAHRLERKTRHYLQFALSGEFQKQFKQDRFRVIVLANSERRLHSIRRAVAATTQKIFRFATLDAVRNEKFFGSVWLRPTGETHQPFFTENL